MGQRRRDGIDPRLIAEEADRLWIRLQAFEDAEDRAVRDELVQRAGPSLRGLQAALNTLLEDSVQREKRLARRKALRQMFPPDLVSSVVNGLYPRPPRKKTSKA